MADERLIKSRHRVKAHGEVFTPRQMVEQMLDLVRPELETGPNVPCIAHTIAPGIKPAASAQIVHAARAMRTSRRRTEPCSL